MKKTLSLLLSLVMLLSIGSALADKSPNLYFEKELSITGMGIHFKFGGHLRRDACRPVEPGIAFGAGQSKHMGDGLRAINQITFEPRQPHLVGLCLDDLVDRARLQKRGAASRECRRRRFGRRFLSNGTWCFRCDRDFWRRRWLAR